MFPEPILGSSDPDTLSGTTGTDFIYGYGGADILSGLEGEDFIYGGAGGDTIQGGAARDELFGDAGADTVRGGAGFDSVFGGLGNDKLYGGDDHDILVTGELGHDSVWGGGGDDGITFRDDGGSAHVYGGTGNDGVSFDLAAKGSVLDGGADMDRLYVGQDDVAPAAKAKLSLVATATGGTIKADGQVVATLKDFEEIMVVSGDAGDLVDLAGSRDNIWVGGGANTVRVRGGDDTVAYTIGEANILAGGTGRDVLLVYGAADTPLVFDALKNTDAFGSTITGFEVFKATGGSGKDKALLGADDDYFAGNGGGDGAWGRGGADQLDGGAGGDWLVGGSGTDTLNGDEGADRLIGGSGVDRLVGHSGADTMTGGAGADVFVFAANGAEADRITDFEAGIDELHIARARIGNALSSGAIEAQHFSEGGPSGTGGQFVLTDEGTSDRLVWDANGTAAGGVVQIAVFTGESGLTFEDLFII